MTREVAQIMSLAPVVPVVVLRRPEDAVPLARALVDGGLPVIEVTLRTPAALDCISAIKEVSGAVAGAGTVLDAEMLRAARAAGADFAVSPGHTRDLLLAAKDQAVPFIPGVASASEAMQALSLGFEVQKLFPAEAVGGTALLSALAGPLPQVRFMPTGGVRAETLANYAQLPNVACVGGTWLASPPLIEAGRWDVITELAREACAIFARARTAPG